MNTPYRLLALLLAAILVLGAVGAGGVSAHHEAPTDPGHACDDEGNANSDGVVQDKNPHCEDEHGEDPRGEPITE